MPQMNGRQLSDELKKHCPDLKTLYMSGYTADVIADKGVLDEGIHFIEKPFQKRHFARKIREVLES
jgi:two-component system cell cycle sensor histidine kinase/response regulator CckA